MSRLKKLLLGALVVALLAVAGVYAYLLFFRPDPPAKLGSSNLDAALAATTVVAASADTGTDTGTVTGTGIDTGTGTGIDGTWSAITDGSTLGYRINEVLGGVDAEAAGRTDQISGSITIAGTTVTAGSFTVDMASVTSDSSRRDSQFRGRIMAVDQFPTATLALTAPIDFGAVPATGQTVTAHATGDLTLHGVTRSVTFDVDAKLDNGRIGVLGQIPVTFSDYGIPDPSNGFAVVKDNGLLEFVVVFQKA